MLREIAAYFRRTDMGYLLTADKGIMLQQIIEGARHGCLIPRCLLIDPTTSCNLRCTGCWAAGYHHHHHLSLEKLREILDEARRMKIRYCMYSGGEPLMRKADLITLAKEYQDISFSAFTNGTLLDEDFADQMAQVGNLTLAFSLEGYEKDTDERRGNGVFEKVLHAMRLLRERDIAFAYSVCYHAKNYQTVASHEFLDFLRQQGAWLGWLFTYIPVGNDADVDMVCSAHERAYVFEQIREYVQKQDFPIIDFWNNGHLSGGCVAGSVGFVHVNARGDIEPCAFCHYADCNIHDTTLQKAMNSPFFKAFRAHHPFHDNPMRTCPVLDNPADLVRAVEEGKAYSTELQSPENVRDLAKKTLPFARAWAKVADGAYAKLSKNERRRYTHYLRILKLRRLFEKRKAIEPLPQEYGEE